MTGIDIVPFDHRYDRAAFSCGKPDMDDWLKRYAGQSERSGTARTSLAVDPALRTVLGYYATTAAFGVGKHRYPLPAILIARLAVAREAQGRGLGKRLLVDALQRIVDASFSKDSRLSLSMRSICRHRGFTVAAGNRKCCARGIIPAYAGSTDGSPATSARTRVHPRLREEHSALQRCLNAGKGSFPPALGAPPPAARTPGATGIIPACAGSTRYRRSGRGSSGDHPRLRGEHPSTLGPQPGRSGSSPPARGAESNFSDMGPDKLDHPRLRGEHTVPATAWTCFQGSSPPTRGAQSRPPTRRRGAGIILACAGSTFELDAAGVALGDHPRLRGEHLLEASRDQAPAGSSPPARGARCCLGRG